MTQRLLAPPYARRRGDKTVYPRSARFGARHGVRTGPSLLVEAHTLTHTRRAAAGGPPPRTSTVRADADARVPSRRARHPSRRRRGATGTATPRRPTDRGAAATAPRRRDADRDASAEPTSTSASVSHRRGQATTPTTNAEGGRARLHARVRTQRNDADAEVRERAPRDPEDSSDAPQSATRRDRMQAPPVSDDQDEAGRDHLTARSRPAAGSSAPPLTGRARAASGRGGCPSRATPPPSSRSPSGRPSPSGSRRPCRSARSPGRRRSASAR